jgi:predicted Rossmann fold nucleotide-binding protein DprA/Smf involved in DNA uptake
MKLAIIGSRGLDKLQVTNDLITKCVKEFCKSMPSLIISGGAKGVDTLAEEWAKTENIPVEVIKPDYLRYNCRRSFSSR